MNKLLAIRQNQMEKRGNKKGFTLVEVIVVLVILAILAAILIPSMIGWINKAEEKSAIVEARTMVLAAQTIMSEKYNDTTYAGDAPVDMTTADIALAEELAELTNVKLVSAKITKRKVTTLVITSSGKKTVTYDGVKGEYKIS